MRLGGDRGAALVEAAIALPLLLMLVFGIVAFSRGYNARVAVTHAAREGVRVLAITGNSTLAETAAKDAAPSLDTPLITVTSTACNPGSPTSLTVSYPFQYEIPIFGARTVTLTDTGVMRCGG